MRLPALSAVNRVPPLAVVQNSRPGMFGKTTVQPVVLGPEGTPPNVALRVTFVRSPSPSALIESRSCYAHGRRHDGNCSRDHRRWNPPFGKSRRSRPTTGSGRFIKP